MGHVTGDEKYECLMLNDVIRNSSIGVGIVYWARLSGSFLGMRYLYLWYSHTISVMLRQFHECARDFNFQVEICLHAEAVHWHLSTSKAANGLGTMNT